MTAILKHRIVAKFGSFCARKSELNFEITCRQKNTRLKVRQIIHVAKNRDKIADENIKLPEKNAK